MTRNRWLLVLTGLIGGLLLSGRLVSLAQDGDAAVRKSEATQAKQPAPGEGQRLPDLNGPAEPVVVYTAGHELPSPGSLQDALLRPYRFTFARPTPLFQVCANLKQTLKAEVVLDLAALDRQDVEPEDPVQLELQGVRLKTGLKLILDQVGLTYRIVAEDNLMIITDGEGSDDPTDRILSELKALHRDLHSLQDDVDELRDLVGVDRQDGRVRKPTIIEELPDVEGQKPVGPDTKPGNPRQKPGADLPAPGARPGPSRVPLHGPRRGVMKRKRIVASSGRARYQCKT
jgi:hypothetical protein